MIVLGEGKAEAEKLLSCPIGYFNILVSSEADQSAIIKTLAKYYHTIDQLRGFVLPTHPHQVASRHQWWYLMRVRQKQKIAELTNRIIQKIFDILLSGTTDQSVLTKKLAKHHHYLGDSQADQ